MNDEVYVELAKPAEHDMTFTIRAIPSLTSDQKAMIENKYYHVKLFNVLGDVGEFTIADGGKVKISAGERLSTRVGFTATNLFTESAATVILPLVATDETGNQCYICYYISQVEMERQDRSKKPYTVITYIDTEMMNPLIADQYLSLIHI